MNALPGYGDLIIGDHWLVEGTANSGSTAGKIPLTRATIDFALDAFETILDEACEFVNATAADPAPPRHDSLGEYLRTRWVELKAAALETGAMAPGAASEAAADTAFAWRARVER